MLLRVHRQPLDAGRERPRLSRALGREARLLFAAALNLQIEDGSELRGSRRRPDSFRWPVQLHNSSNR
jgi:hypothetical protein